MANITLKGVAKVRAKGRTYWYAWRGGPRLAGEPGTPEFVASYNEAIANLRTPEPGRFRSLVVQYKSSQDFKRLAESTRRNWGPWLDRVGEYFGPLRLAQFDRPEKMRPIIRRWRQQWAEKPRTADYALQVLSTVLSYGVTIGSVGNNPCMGMERLYSSNRSEIIWTPDDIAQLKSACSAEIAAAVDLAAYTGLREGDLVRLSWSHIGENEIRIATGKSNRKQIAIVPLYDDLRALLTRLPRQSTSVLTNARRRPWTAGALASAFIRAKATAGMEDRDLHFHDLRGTAATMLYTAGINERAIAEILGWQEQQVFKIIRRYVSRNAATLALIRQLNERRS